MNHSAILNGFHTYSHTSPFPPPLGDLIPLGSLGPQRPCSTPPTGRRCGTAAPRHVPSAADAAGSQGEGCTTGRRFQGPWRSNVGIAMLFLMVYTTYLWWWMGDGWLLLSQHYRRSKLTSCCTNMFVDISCDIIMWFHQSSYVSSIMAIFSVFIWS